MPDKYTAKQAAEILGISPRCVLKHIEHGRITATKTGKSWYLTPAEVERAKHRPGEGWPKGKPRSKPV